MARVQLDGIIFKLGSEGYHCLWSSLSDPMRDREEMRRSELGVGEGAKHLPAAI